MRGWTIFCVVSMLGCGGSVPESKVGGAPHGSQDAFGSTASIKSSPIDSGKGIATPKRGADGKDVFTGVNLGSGLFVDSEIAQRCGIQADAVAPKFDFDSATMSDSDRTVLVKLASCLTEGALRGRRVALVGHADAVGEAEFNLSLGEMRADAVRRYLHDLGVSEEKLSSTSRGEMDAVGNDDATRAIDRRVDVQLAD